jgi:hypothetical protein
MNSRAGTGKSPPGTAVKKEANELPCRNREILIILSSGSSIGDSLLSAFLIPWVTDIRPGEQEPAGEVGPSG